MHASTFLDPFLKQFSGLERLKGMVQEAVPLSDAIPDDLSACQRMLSELLAALKLRDRELDGLRHRLDQRTRPLKHVSEFAGCWGLVLGG